MLPAPKACFFFQFCLSLRSLCRLWMMACERIDAEKFNFLLANRNWKRMKHWSRFLEARRRMKALRRDLFNKSWWHTYRDYIIEQLLDFSSISSTSRVPSSHLSIIIFAVQQHFTCSWRSCLWLSSRLLSQLSEV
jgi:hypothetical protein